MNTTAAASASSTAGKLGALESPAYAPELHTLKLLGWIGALELGVAILLVRAGMFVENRFWRILFLVLLLLPVARPPKG